jgi:malonyl-CoA O-methyltransferase
MPDKQLISQNFSASAAGYDRHSIMQRDMADRLFSLLPEKYSPSKIIDLGCGTGYLTAKLAEQFPAARVEGIDIAPGMIAVAEKQQHNNLSFKVGDGEEAFGSDYDLVVSNASLQWMSIEKTFTRVVALLKPGGLFVFTTFGPKTLIELKECGFRVNEFPDTIAIEQLLKPDFHNVFLASQVYREEFPGVKELIYYLKELGAQTSNEGETFSPSSFRRYKERYSIPEGVSASFEPIYGVFRRKAE